MNKTLKIAIIVDDVLISDYLAELIIWSKSIDSVEISNYLYLVSDEKNESIKKSRLQKFFSLSFWKEYPKRKFKNFIFSFEKKRNLKNNKIHKNSINKHDINTFGLNKIEVYPQSTKSKFSFKESGSSIIKIK